MKVTKTEQILLAIAAFGFLHLVPSRPSEPLRWSGTCPNCAGRDSLRVELARRRIGLACERGCSFGAIAHRLELDKDLRFRIGPILVEEAA